MPTFLPATKNKRSLFLASQSPRRADILKNAGFSFTVIPNLLKEENLYKRPKLSLRYRLRMLAVEKAKKSAATYKGLILASDTIVVLNNKILGKPKTYTEAEAFLAMLSGKTHHVFSSAALFDSIDNKTTSCSMKTEVTFRQIQTDEIKKYIKKVDVLDKAGAYALQNDLYGFVTRINGSTENVVGLPLQALLHGLKNYDIVRC